MSSDYAEVFGAGGPLARQIPGYRYRREQVAMAQAVGRALSHNEPLLVEAGTGTGKTFAYLIPALLSGKSVIISTGTRTLQDQLFHRDAPNLARAIGMPVTIALLKGRSNYLCRHRLDQAVEQPSLFGFDKLMLRQLGKVKRWAEVTRQGDLAELRDIPERSPVWPLVTSTRDNCLGQECPRFGHCHVYEARRAAQAAQVVVVNHHLLLADLGLKEEGFGDLLPGAEAVILDEAHQVPDIAAQFFGLSWSTRQLQSMIRDSRAELMREQSGSSAVDDALHALDAGVMELMHDLSGGAGKLTRDSSGDAGKSMRDLSDAAGRDLPGSAAKPRRDLPAAARRIEWADLPSSAFETLERIEAELIAAGDAFETLGERAATLVCARRCRQLAAALTTLRHVDDADGLRWIELGTHGIQLHFTPFEIAARLRAYMDARPCAWIFTSATLALGADFSHFADRIGLPDARALRVESPFDFAAQALIYLPRAMPLPQDPGYTMRFVEACAPLLEASGGRAFLLFTSYRGLAEGVKAMAHHFPAPHFPLLVQGEAPRDALLTRFRELGNAVLLATGSFWEGVDVKGEALSVVAIDKLPFASPDDPLLKARLEGIRRRGGNPFFEYQVPQAVLALKQGVGRLIRDLDDFGVIMIGDPRLTSKGYGRIFLDALPPSPVITDARRAAEFLSRRLKLTGST